MNEKISSISDVSVAVTQVTDGSKVTTSLTSSSSSIPRESQVYFQCAVVVIGVVAMATNALVLYAMRWPQNNTRNTSLLSTKTLSIFSEVSFSPQPIR